MSKNRVVLMLEDGLFSALKSAAQSDNRSVNNYVTVVLSGALLGTNDAQHKPAPTSAQHVQPGTVMTLAAPVSAQLVHSPTPKELVDVFSAPAQTVHKPAPVSAQAGLVGLDGEVMEHDVMDAKGDYVITDQAELTARLKEIQKINADFELGL